jgi:6-phosphogluconolactonase
MGFIGWIALGCLGLTLTSTLGCASDKGGSMRVYFGTYTGGDSKGIYVSDLNLADGHLSEPRLAAGTVSPSFLAIHPKGELLYAVSEIEDFEGKKTGGVGGFAIDPKTGLLTALNKQPSRGGGPCHLVVDATGRNVLVANYGGGSVASLPIDENGRLGEATGFAQHQGSSVNERRQSAPHAHSINVDPNNRFAFAADLGLDKVLVYRFDAAKGSLEPNDPPAAEVAPGSGPRHFAFHPSGKFAYVINEIFLTVTAFAYDDDKGTLTELQTISTLPDGVERTDKDSTAEVQVHPSGKFLYGSNRGHNSLAIFSIDEKTGRLTHVGNQSTGGKTPRNFGIDPTGKYVLAANQASDTVVVFRVDMKTGKLEPTGQKLAVPAPVCVKFLRTGS